MNGSILSVSPASDQPTEPKKTTKTPKVKLQKAADRTQQRRVIRQQLQRTLRQILANYRIAIRAARDEIRWLREYLSQFQSAGSDVWWLTEEPVAPSRTRGQAPSLRQIAEFLWLHAQWETLSGRGRERLLREHKNWLESAAQQEAMEAIDQALNAALEHATGKPALQHTLRLLALEAHLKVRGRSRAEAPALISQLYEQVSNRHPDYSSFHVQSAPEIPIRTEITEEILFPATMGSVRVRGVWRATQADPSAWAFAHEK